MILPFMVATVLLFSSLLAYATAMHLIVRVMVRLIRSGSSELGFWKSTAVMAIVMLITAAAHLTQIALWAVAFLLCGQVSTLETAFCLSAQNFTAFGYGDVLLSERWRLLGPLEATQRPSVFRTVDGRVVRDHEPVDRQPPTHRNRVPDRGSREPGASVGGRRRVVELSTPILVRRTLVRSETSHEQGGADPGGRGSTGVQPLARRRRRGRPSFMEILDTTIATASRRHIAVGGAVAVGLGLALADFLIGRCIVDFGTRWPSCFAVPHVLA